MDTLTQSVGWHVPTRAGDFPLMSMGHVVCGHRVFVSDVLPQSDSWKPGSDLVDQERGVGPGDGWSWIWDQLTVW